MARGSSGRIVVEIDPQLKRDLYVELTRRDLTLKAWLMKEAQSLITNGKQQSLFPHEQTNEDDE